MPRAKLTKKKKEIYVINKLKIKKEKEQYFKILKNYFLLKKLNNF
jgi:hypothetical protein